MSDFVEILAAIAYPLWSALCLFWVFISLARWRITHRPQHLLIVMVAGFYFVAMLLLSFSRGALMVLPFESVALPVRVSVLCSGISMTLYTAYYIRFHYKADQINGDGH